VVMIHQRHRQTDRQTTCDRKTALCTIMHRAVKKTVMNEVMRNCQTTVKLRSTGVID